MAKAKKEGPSRARTAGGQKLGDFAVDLGRLLGKTQARAQVWMKQREAIAGQLAHVRDTASRLLGELGEAAGLRRPSRRKGAAKLLQDARTAVTRGAKRTREFTASQRKAQSLRMKPYWTRVRKAKKG